MAAAAESQPDDEFERHKLARQESLKQSKEQAMSQSRLFISREERQNRLLQMYEKTAHKDKLELANFLK